MLRINRIKAVSKTESGDYGFDYKLKDGLNLIASATNTRGKSSVILSIYYCLGFEELVGGKGMKTLTSVYKNTLKDEHDVSHNVLESEVWAEISNGTDTITVLRTAQMLGRNENLVTVYYSDMDKISNSETYIEDMYVHAQRSTTSKNGFHNFLEKFIGFELPLVPTNDEVEYKLYMQLLFSAIFIEQKRGWADLFSAMPALNIKDAKKRLVEYLLALDTLTNEKKRTALRLQEYKIYNKWELVVSEIQAMCNREDCRVQALPIKPRILDDGFEDKIVITTIGQNPETIDEKISDLDAEREEQKGIAPKIVDNYDNLQSELERTEESISVLEQELGQQLSIITAEKAMVVKLIESLETINNDLRNNKDALKLKQMGSALGANSYEGVCPVCHQTIEDSLLPSQNCDHVMSIEDNIKHLESQRTMITFALGAHRKNRSYAEENAQSLSGTIFTLRRLAKTIRNDLYSVDENLSETVVYKRIQLENRIQELNALKNFISQKLIEMKQLSDEWREHLNEKSGLPKTKFSNSDNIKVETLEKYFKYYLKAFNYQSASDYDSIQISNENYLPTSEGFDMKFDSSASDNIRAIWAYTLALLRTSVETGGNHPRIIIFDEPAQHSIITDDVVSLFNAVIEIPGNNQVILGITLGDGDIRKAVEEFDNNRINLVDVGNHSFKLI
jgi:hypothetical protein